MAKLIPGYYRCTIASMRWKSDYIKTGDTVLATKIDIRKPRLAEKLATRFEFVKALEAPKPTKAPAKKASPKKQPKQGGN